MKRTVAVIGGTGTLGQPVARCLKGAGFRVRIMTRYRQKALKLFDESFEIFAEDPMDPSCLEEALDGCYGLHISLSSEAEQPVAEMIARIAPDHGVERISYISGATVAEENRWFPMINRKFLAEEAIRQGKTPYTIFCPTWIMESLPMFVVQGRASVLGKQPCPYHWLAADDLAFMVATAYTRLEAANRRLIVYGPEAIPMHEALRRYCAVFHPDIKQVATMPFWLVNLLVAITRNSDLKFAGETMAYFEKVGEPSRSSDVNGSVNVPTTTLDQWLQARKAKHNAVTSSFSPTE